MCMLPHPLTVLTYEECCRMWRHIVWQNFTSVPKEHITFYLQGRIASQQEIVTLFARSLCRLTHWTWGWRHYFTPKRRCTYIRLDVIFKPMELLIAIAAITTSLSSDVCYVISSELGRNFACFVCVTSVLLSVCLYVCLSRWLLNGWTGFTLIPYSRVYPS
jgi:hypothetical protein